MELNKIKKILDFKTERIIGRRKYFNSSVLIPIVEIENKEYLLFQKRAKNIRQGGEISFPGGRYEKEDVNFCRTAVRETVEELGISKNSIEVIGELGTLIIPGSVIVEAFVGRLNISSINELDLNYDEVERVILIPLKFFIENPPRVEMLSSQTLHSFEKDGELYEFPAKELNLPPRYHKPWSGKPREVYFYEWENEVIWGITAELIVELVEEIRGIK